MESLNTNAEFPVSECTLFSNLPDKTLEEINRKRQFRTLKKGERLYSEGETPEGVFCIHKGYIKAFKIASDKKEQIIYLPKPGDIIGWQQLNCANTYSTCAEALENSLISYLAKEDFIKIIKGNDLGASLIQYICNDVIMLENKVLELSQKSVRERLATNILLLYDRFGVVEEDKSIITIPLTREDFANLIGTNTETVIKLFSELRKEGHIDFMEKRMVILNINALRKFSDFYK